MTDVQRVVGGSLTIRITSWACSDAPTKRKRRSAASQSCRAILGSLSTGLSRVAGCLGLCISSRALRMCASSVSTGMVSPGCALAWGEYGVPCRRKWPHVRLQALALTLRLHSTRVISDYPQVIAGIGPLLAETARHEHRTATEQAHPKRHPSATTQKRKSPSRWMGF